MEVCVNVQEDWELIYKHPEIRVKCLHDSCDTLLSAKRMNRSGLRFLAVRSGGCSHHLVELPVGEGEQEQDPSTLSGGGGPEGQEHLWIKGRLYKIARALKYEAVIEHSPTNADVFLPGPGLALEYQRWDTDFRSRSQSRSESGARTTLWLFPSPPKDAPRSAKLNAFNREVYEQGGLFLSVLNPDNWGSQRPWENSSQERTARLYASGSIAEFDPKREQLVRGKRRSMATVLKQIIDGELNLVWTEVYSKGAHQVVPARVWVHRKDLALAEGARRRAPRRLATHMSPVEDALLPSSKVVNPQILATGRTGESFTVTQVNDTTERGSAGAANPDPAGIPAPPEADAAPRTLTEAADQAIATDDSLTTHTRRLSWWARCISLFRGR